MTAYALEAIQALILPMLFLLLFSYSPIVVGLYLIRNEFRKKSYFEFLNIAFATTVAGIATLLLLWSSFFGDSLNESSTASLIFAVVPFYSAAVLFLSYGVGWLFSGSKDIGLRVKQWFGNKILLVAIPPVSIFMLLLISGLLNSLSSVHLSVAESASSELAIRYIYEKAKNEEIDQFGVFLFLAQNRNTPQDIVRELSVYPHRSVRSLAVQLLDND